MTLPLENKTPIWSPRLEAADCSNIWAIAGGKGGVGKSLTTSNLSICLALMGYKVIAIDLDLGGANLHTMLGIPIPKKTLSDCLVQKKFSMEDLLTPTPIQNLHLISGAQDSIGISNLQQTQKLKILSQIRKLSADFILLDLGAGTHFNTIDFFMSADQGILVALPEPTSIENVYRFIKALYYRRVRMTEDYLEITPFIDRMMKQQSNQEGKPINLINKVKEINSELGNKLESEIANLNLKLIINQTRTQSDANIGPSMKIVCKKYFGITMDYVGHLEYDPTVWQSVKKRRPLLVEFPNSSLVTNFDQVIHQLLNIS